MWYKRSSSGCTWLYPPLPEYRSPHEWNCRLVRADTGSVTGPLSKQHPMSTSKLIRRAGENTVRRLPTQAVLLKVLDYNPATGALTWKVRHASDFPTTRPTWNGRYAGKLAFTFVGSQGYLRGNIFNKSCFAHRVIWKMVHGKDAVQIDHKNGDRADNQIENLRNATRSQNYHNAKRKSANTSGIKGVHWDASRGMWVARVTTRRKIQWLGRHATLGAAEAARVAAARISHGEFFRRG